MSSRTSLRRSHASLVTALVPLALLACGGTDAIGSGTSGTGGGAGVGGQGGTLGQGGAATDVACKVNGWISSAKPECTTAPEPSSTPDPRADTAGVLAADGCTFLMFGGDTALPVCGQNPKRAHAGDTWLLDSACGVWTEVTGDGPPARARHSMALDDTRNRALLFGGRTRKVDSGPYALFNDVWAFDFLARTWSPLATTGAAPSARSNAAMAVNGDHLIVFGGNTSTSGLTFSPQNDTYSLDLTSLVWTKLAPSGTLPKARLFHSMVKDPTGSRLLVSSGGDANAFVGPFFNDLWSLDLEAPAWIQVTPKKGMTDSSGRIKLGLSVRAPNEGETGPVALVFAGHDDGILGNRNDVIAVDLGAATPTWSSALAGDVFDQPSTGACKFPADFVKTDLASPERRSAFAFGARSDGKAFVVVGGDSDCGRLSDAWWFDAGKGVWTVIRATLPGLTCPRTGAGSCSGLCG